MSKKVELFTSSATSNLKVKKDQTSFKFLLEKYRTPYTEYDAASDQEAKERFRALLKEKGHNNIILPGLVVDGEYKGDYDWANDLADAHLFGVEIGAEEVIQTKQQ